MLSLTFFQTREWMATYCLPLLFLLGQTGVANWRHKRWRSWVKIRTIYWNQQWAKKRKSNSNNTNDSAQGKEHYCSPWKLLTAGNTLHLPLLHPPLPSGTELGLCYPDWKEPLSLAMTWFLGKWEIITYGLLCMPAYESSKTVKAAKGETCCGMISRVTGDWKRQTGLFCHGFLKQKFASSEKCFWCHLLKSALGLDLLVFSFSLVLLWGLTFLWKSLVEWSLKKICNKGRAKMFVSGCRSSMD